MVKIEAIIKPSRLTEVQNALKNNGIRGLTIMEVRDFAHDEGHVEQYRSARYRVDLVPKMLIRVVVSEDRLDEVVNIIQKAAVTGKTGDGSIFTSRVDDVMRIRTGATGLAAL